MDIKTNLIYHSHSKEVAVSEVSRIEDLPRCTAAQVKNNWGKLVREVRAHGSVAVTRYGETELVVVEAKRYEKMRTLAEKGAASEDPELLALKVKFNARLATLQTPDFAARIDKIFALQGRSEPRPKAGSY